MKALVLGLLATAMAVIELPFEQILQIIEGPDSVVGQGITLARTDDNGRAVFAINNYLESEEGELVQEYYASDEFTNPKCQDFIKKFSLSFGEARKLYDFEHYPEDGTFIFV